MAENLGAALKRYLRDSSRWHSLRDRAHTELGASATSDPWLGHTRTFRMLREVSPENPQIPTDEKDVARRAPEILAGLPDQFAHYVNSTVARDRGNLAASADIVDPETGVTIAQNVPAITLMALNKDMGEWVALIRDLPVAPADTRWERDPESNALVAVSPTTSLRTQRMRRPLKMAEETDRHPAQFHIENEDVPVAEITHTKYHGGVLAAEKREMLETVQRAQLAVSQALENANANHQAEPVTGIGEALVRLALPSVG